MADAVTFDVEAAHRWFARQFNNGAWDLLEKPQRSPAEDDALLAAAYAAWQHWSAVGTAVNAQRAHHLLATVHARLGVGVLALRHAEACMALSRQNGEAQTPFDRASAMECLARARACSGDTEQAARLRKEAEQLGAAIPVAQERAVAEELLRAGPWFGVK